jgi:putative aldouronate transport system substrate-binding protein
MKRVLLRTAITAALFCVAAGFVAAAGAADASLAAEPLEIRWFGIRGFPGEDTPYPEILEDLVSKKVGFPVTFEMLGGVEDGALHSTIDMMLAANELPDVFQRFNVDPVWLDQAVAKFSFDEYKEYMPEHWKWINGLIANLGADPDEIWAMVVDPADGMLWGHPGVWEDGWIPQGQIWRKDLVEDLGYDIPRTIDEAEKVFEAFKEVYPNKYALTGRGQTDWQCFDLVFNAFGIVGGGNHVRDGKIVQFYATREFRESLQVLRRWYDKGFWDPNFVNHAMEWATNFEAGNYLVTQWMGWNNWDFGAGEVTRYLEGLRNVPGAEPVAAPHLRAYPDKKPMQRVWNPIMPQPGLYGKHLENDRDKLHRIMQVQNVMTTDRETVLLKAYGIEGEHYTYDLESEDPDVPRPTQKVTGLTTAGVLQEFGYGYYWYGGGVATPNLFKTKRQQRVIDEFVFAPGAMYGAGNLDLWYSWVTGAVTDEKGEAVQASTPTSWFQLAVDIMTGVQPIEYYDEWLQSYYDAGGKDWERHATRLYLKNF